jgi:hypothetical protein
MMLSLKWTTQQYRFVEAEAVASRCKRAQLHDRLVVPHEQMLDNELGPFRENLVQLVEGPSQEGGLGTIVTRKRMCSLDVQSTLSSTC